MELWDVYGMSVVCRIVLGSFSSYLPIERHDGIGAQGHERERERERDATRAEKDAPW